MFIGATRFTRFSISSSLFPAVSFACLLLLNALPRGMARAQQKAPPPPAPRKVDFARDVQPVLKAHCYQCHSQTQTQGGLALDSRARMFKGGASGAALVPGNGDKSLLLVRVLGHDGKARMPLGFAPLTEAQTDSLRAWIAQGAVWPEGSAVKKHWAYAKPMRPALPKVANKAWPRNSIDAFVLARIEKAGLTPSPQADKITLLRRVKLDLTGLPPTPQEVNAFLADKSSDAYEKAVDRLLASPHYGERMALPWLDAARYADSNGFQQDGDTYQYLWRDWVVKAYNANMPFDQFTKEQLAGDLLPNATPDQKLATAFNRCHLLNGEGGAIAEEQRNVILFDRVDVTATTWLGATMACAQCHDHKYDPITQKDYYSFLAFFNNVPESGTPPGGGQYRIADPAMPVPDTADTAKLKAFEEQIAGAKAQSDGYTREHAAELAAAQTAWETETLHSATGAPFLDIWQAAGPFPAASFDAAYDIAFFPEQQIVKAADKRIDLAQTYEGGKFKWAAHPEWTDGKVYQLDGENTSLYLYRAIRAERAMPLALSFGSDDAIKVWLNGVSVLTDKASRAALPDQDKATVQLKAGDNFLLVKIVNGGGIGGFYFKTQDSGVPSSILAVLKTPAASRSAAQSQQVRDYFLSASAPAAIKDIRTHLAMLTKEREAYRAGMPRVMIMSDDRPRKTHILERGNYEMPRDEVQADTPASLASLPSTAPHNRLGLAQWLVSADNPLVARVQVNRLWQLFFGQGLVKTSENFGTQSEPPTHPELLDWLAVDFREHNWDVKRLVRMLVTSATYRQSSKISPALRQRDPENKLLARGARFRLPSLLLRDLALSASGLLNAQIGGKPVYPYQPQGIWDGLAITKERDFTYPQSKGADLYRRSLYTFWRRTVAPSNMFDASVRNTCKVRLTVTSTPLHALTTLNDVTWVEAGRALAEHVMKEAGTDPDSRLAEAFRRVCARRPEAEELKALRRSLNRAQAAFRADPAQAKAYLSAGDSSRDTTLDSVDHAAYASVCLAIFNLDEALTRE